MTTAGADKGAGTDRRAGAAAARANWATLIGFTAVPMWATLALLTTLTGTVPPFQLVAMSFTLAFVFGLAWPLSQGRPALQPMRQPPLVWLVGVGGLFGYHFFIFTGLKLAPPVEASLINYTWPLLIVLFSGLLPGERLRWWHIAGAGLGLAGAVLLITGGGSLDLQAEYMAGYGAAAAAALTWSSYSVISRRFGQVPTEAVGGFCGATALLALLSHLALEETVWPDGLGWLAILCLGLGPVGLAFFVWDHGVKKGDIQVLGATAYSAPLLSTLLLIAFGQGTLSWVVAVACAAIVGGAVLAGRDLFRRRATPSVAD